MSSSCSRALLELGGALAQALASFNGETEEELGAANAVLAVGEVLQDCRAILVCCDTRRACAQAEICVTGNGRFSTVGLDGPHRCAHVLTQHLCASNPAENDFSALKFSELRG